jgi:hypothetical protein
MPELIDPSFGHAVYDELIIFLMHAMCVGECILSNFFLECGYPEYEP